MESRIIWKMEYLGDAIDSGSAGGAPVADGRLDCGPSRSRRGKMEYQDSQNDSMDSGIYIIRLLSQEQHNVLVFNIGIERVAEIFHFPDTFGITHQVDPRKWDISATHAIQTLKPGASCFSHESSIRTSNLESDESNVIWSHLAHPLAASYAACSAAAGLILTSGQKLTSGQMSGDPPESVWGEINSIAGQTQFLVKFD